MNRVTGTTPRARPGDPPLTTATAVATTRITGATGGAPLGDLVLGVVIVAARRRRRRPHARLAGDRRHRRRFGGPAAGRWCRPGSLPSVPGFVSTLARPASTTPPTLDGQRRAGRPRAPAVRSRSYIPQATTEVRLVATGADGATDRGGRRRHRRRRPRRRTRRRRRCTSAAEDWAEPGDPPAGPRPRRRRPHQRRRARHQGRGRRGRLRQRRPAGHDDRRRGGRPLRRPPGDRRAARARCAGHRPHRLLPRPGAGQVGVGERPAAT